jgi:thiol-disulfide isomerase/thioredoxin
MMDRVRLTDPPVSATLSACFTSSNRPFEQESAMSPTRPFAVLLAAAALTVLATVRPATADVAVGDKPPLHFEAFGTHKTVDLADLKGKIVVVDFWATWCGPCMAEAGHMVKVNEEYGPKGLQFLGISLDSDPSALPPVIKEKGFTWPMSYEGAGWQGKLPRTWGVNSIPQTFIIGPDGTVLWRGHPAELDAPLAKAFQDHPPQLVDPATLAAANSTLSSAEAAVGTDPAKAMKLLASFPVAAESDADTKARLTALTDKLTAFGQQQLDAAQGQIDAKQFAEAAKTLRTLSQALAGLPIGTTAKEKLAALERDPAVRASLAADKRSAAADAALAKAKSLKAAGKDELAYPRFQDVAKAYAGTPAAAEAADAVKAYEADAAFVARVKAKSDGRRAESTLSMADAYRSAGNVDKAKAKYQEVIDAFPNTAYAETAKKGLAALAGT